MQLYQKTPLKNEMLGSVLSFAVFLVFFCVKEVVWLIFSPDDYLLNQAFLKLTSLAQSFASNLFAFYWLNRYAYEKLCPIQPFQLKRGLLYATFMVGANGLINQIISFQLPEELTALLFLPLSLLQLLLSAVLIFFVTDYLLYKGIGLDTAGEPLSYRSFLKKEWQFVRKHVSLFLLCVAASIVFFVLLVFLGASAMMLGMDVKAIMDDPLLINLYMTILILITVMIPWASAKIKVAFVVFFAEGQPFEEGRKDDAPENL